MPYAASAAGHLFDVVQSNEIYLPQDLLLVSTGLASRKLNTECLASE